MIFIDHNDTTRTVTTYDETGAVTCRLCRDMGATPAERVGRHWRSLTSERHH